MPIMTVTELEGDRANKTEIKLHSSEVKVEPDTTIDRCIRIEIIGPNSTKLDEFLSTEKERHYIYFMDNRSFSIPADAILVLESNDLDFLESNRTEDRAMLMVALANASFSQEPCLGLSHITTELPNIKGVFQEKGVLEVTNSVNHYLGMFAKTIAKAKAIAKECGYAVDEAFNASLRGLALTHARILYQEVADIAPDFWDRTTDIELFDPVTGTYQKAHFQKMEIALVTKQMEGTYPKDFTTATNEQTETINRMVGQTDWHGYKEQEPLFRALTRLAESKEIPEIEIIEFDYDYGTYIETEFGGKAYEVIVKVVTDHGDVILNDFMPPNRKIYGCHHPTLHYYCIARGDDAENIVIDPDHIANAQKGYRDSIISIAHEIGHSYTLLSERLRESEEFKTGIAVLKRILDNEQGTTPTTSTDKFYKTAYSTAEFNNFLLYLIFRNEQETEAWNYGKVVAKIAGISDIEYEDTQSIYINTYWYDAVRKTIYVADRCSGVGDEMLVAIYNPLLQNEEEITIGELRKFVNNPNTSARENTNASIAVNMDF